MTTSLLNKLRLRLYARVGFYTHFNGQHTHAAFLYSSVWSAVALCTMTSTPMALTPLYAVQGRLRIMVLLYSTASIVLSEPPVSRSSTGDVSSPLYGTCPIEHAAPAISLFDALHVVGQYGILLGTADRLNIWIHHYGCVLPHKKLTNFVHFGRPSFVTDCHPLTWIIVPHIILYVHNERTV